MWCKAEFISCKHRSSSQPAGIPSHDLDDIDTFQIVNIGVIGNLTDGTCNVFGSRAKAWCMVCHDQIVVDRLWHTDDADIIADGSRVSRELGNRIHGIVSADIEECTDVHFLKDGEDFFVHRNVVLHIWQLEPAGTEVHGWCACKLLDECVILV